jgi:hypothetical protein
MTLRAGLLSTTFLAGLACGVLTAPPLHAQTAPAVDGINGKLEGLGGGFAKQGFFGAAGSLSVPLGGQFGAQLDAGAGSFATRFLGALGGHLFWRDPGRGLFGVYGDYANWDQFGGVHVGHAGVEGEAYLGRFTFGGVVGIESGNNNVGTNTTVATIFGPGTLTTVSSSLQNKTRFFDRLSVSYYLTDNWKASIGHRYTGGKNALALGTEYAFAGSGGMLPTLFVEGRLGEGSNNYGAWGGLRVYFGHSDKTLIRRHREDDPINDFGPDTLFSIGNGLPASSATATCPAGEFFVNGQCLAPSDTRLKRDVVLLARLDSGIGLYCYRYLWSDTAYVGVMAQEVLKIVPEAVTTAADGTYRVDYGRLGLRLMTWGEWQAQTPRAA